MLDHLVVREGTKEKAVEVRFVVLAVVHMVVEFDGYLRRYRTRQVSRIPNSDPSTSSLTRSNF
jgi:hypothetical protein